MHCIVVALMGFVPEDCSFWLQLCRFKSFKSLWALKLFQQWRTKCNFHLNDHPDEGCTIDGNILTMEKELLNLHCAALS